MDTTARETRARLLAEALETIGTVTYTPRLAGLALLEDGVMFGFIEQDGTAYLRASQASAHRFHALGSAKHPEMPYWSVPSALWESPPLLRELAYEAADIAHIAASFGVDDEPLMRLVRPNAAVRNVMKLALLAA